jgi:polyhydroxyalkanoate synthesis regulator phasin
VAVREELGHYEVLPNDILLNLATHPHPPQKIEPAPTQAASDFLKSTYQLECRARCQSGRQHFARVCREYLEKSFNARIDRAQERAMLLAAEAVSKREFRLAADEARKYVDELQHSRQERLDGLKRLEIARTGPVKHVGTAFVLAPDADTQAQLADLADEFDPNIRRQSEIAAEDKVIEALVAEGFPQDRIERVGHLKLGLDIRAHRIADEGTGEVFVKRIEVKGRLRGQPVRLTTNEWYKAQQLAETYWLYVVWDPLSDSPGFMRIHNPVAKLDHAKREIMAARFYEISAGAVMMAASQGMG